ncbi:multidrug effflux MFS transporter [Ideonella livida]|uniref:Bcr/CflA family efflux transporter n=1 Tax=Ideonella livida TaxID=2707176 RepID=A0A7C9PKT8_9BURK|nr:multidrug effflux MFS transporter [Ideonella livida]NDY93772.1 multidrug effflux MFS transporter [Ideonella livida]
MRTTLLAPGAHEAPRGLTPGLLVLLGSLIGFAPLAIDMYLPAFPTMAQDLHAPESAVQGTLAAYLAGMAAGQIAYGQLADRWGRRLPLMLGLALFLLASLGCAQAASVGELTAWRLLQALGGCAGVVMPLTIVADRVQGEAEMARAMSRLMAVIGLAPVAAPSLGTAVLGLTSWRGIFVLLAVLAAAALVAVWRGLDDHRPVHHAPAGTPRPGPLQAWGTLLRDRRFALAVLVGPLASAGMFAYIGASAFVLIGQHGLSTGQFSAVFAANALVLTLASQVNAQLVRRWRPTQVLAAALPAVTLVGLGLVGLGWWAPQALWPLLLGLGLFMAGLGLVSANGSALALSGHAPQHRGLASGLMGTLQFALGAAVGAALEAGGHVDASVMALAMTGCAAAAWAAALARQRLAPPATA